MSALDDRDSVHFRQFASNLELALQKYGNITEDKTLLEHQRQQIKTLISLENLFRKTLIDHHWGPGVYRDFVKLICDQKRNILAARPYFRERQTTFTNKISGALKRRRDRELYRFKFNWSFISFVLKSRKWPPGGKIVTISKQIEQLRTEILEQNLPLAISQARIFWSNTPKSHLSYMDIVQIQNMGLLLAIDKFVPPNDKKMSNKDSLDAYRKFRAVAIGIMTRDRVNQYSETLIHFYPKDKLKIYRANKVLRKFAGEVDYERLAEMVNVELEGDERTNAVEIADLISSASTVSSDFVPDEESPDTVATSFPDDEAHRPDMLLEDSQASFVLKTHLKELILKEKKLLRMKGIVL